MDEKTPQSNVTGGNDQDSGPECNLSGPRIIFIGWVLGNLSLEIPVPEGSIKIFEGLHYYTLTNSRLGWLETLRTEEPDKESVDPSETGVDVVGDGTGIETVVRTICFLTFFGPHHRPN